MPIETMTFQEGVLAGRLPDAGWLAGYPRSGAALVRLILASCFDHWTGTIYSEGSIGTVYADVLHILPQHMPLTDLAEIASRQGVVLFKTHEKPRPAERIPTIVIVRDGRRTLESLRAFYVENEQVAPHRSSLVGTDSMMEMIRGNHVWGSWSAWIRAWAASAPATALWLRYEDIMAVVPGAVRRIGLWLRRTPSGYEIPSFESLHQAHPTIFRSAFVDGNGGMTEQEEALFWELHGGAMTMLGYHHD